jgi:hypothetical protein
MLWKEDNLRRGRRNKIWSFGSNDRRRLWGATCAKCSLSIQRKNSF